MSQHLASVLPAKKRIHIKKELNMKKTKHNTIKKQDEDFKKKLVSFDKSLKSFKEIYSAYSKKPNKIGRLALLKSFELAFELSWKTLQAFFNSQGYTGFNSPRRIIKEAFNKEFIKNGEIWISMLNDRNKLSHIYDESILTKIVKDISKDYVKELENLYKNLKKELSNGFWII